MSRSGITEVTEGKRTPMSQMEIKRRQIICYTYIIGVIGLISMGRLLGDNGLAYMAVAMEAVSIFSLLTLCGVSDVIARLQKNRRNKGQYKGVARMRRQLLIIQGVVGMFLTVLCLSLSNLVAEKLFRVPYSASAMKILAPVIVLQALEVVFLGYFQGSGSYMPSLVGTVLRQGFFLVFGSLFGKLLAGYGDKVSALLKNNCYGGMYGAMGVALGMLVAEILVLLFLFIIYMVSDRKADEQRSQEGLRRTESMGDILRVFYGSLWQGMCTVLPVLLAVAAGAALYLNRVTKLYEDVSAIVPAEESGEEMIPLAVQSANEAIAGYGSFFGKCFLLCLIFVLILAARCFPVYGRLCAAVRREDTRHSRDVAACGLHYVWVAGLYITVTMAVMAPQMAAGFFPDRDAGVSAMLRSGSVLVLLAALAVMLSVVLLAYGERFILMGMLGIWLILELILQQAFVKISGYSVTGILSAAMLATGLLVAGLAAYNLWRERLNTEYIRILGIPLIGAGIMGLVMMLVTKLLGAHMGHVVSLVVAALLGAIVYGAILMVTRNIREYEISILYGKQVRKLLERIIS